MIAKLSIYVEALEPEWSCMTRRALLMAQRAFKFFPSIKELADFLPDHRPASQAKPAPAPDRMHQSRLNCLARLAMRGWSIPSSLGFRGHRAWEAWALEKAVDAVRDGRIDGEFVSSPDGPGWLITSKIPAPIVPDALYEEWRSLPFSDWP